MYETRSPDGRYGTGSTAERFFDGWASLVQRHPWHVIIASLIFIGAAASGARFITINGDYHVYFKPDNPDLLAWEDILKTYTRADSMVVAVQAEDGRQVFSPEVAPAIVKLTDTLWHMPYVTRVDSVTNFQNMKAVGEDLTVEDLIPAAQASSSEFLRQREQIARNEPYLDHVMLSKDGTATAIFVQMMLPQDSGGISQATRGMLDLKQQFEQQHPGLRMHLSGLVMLNGAFDFFARQDMATILPAMFAITIVMMALIFRSAALMAASLTTVLLIVMSAMGIAGYLGIPLGPHSSVSPQIIKTISVATIIYFILSLRTQLKIDERPDVAIRNTVRINIVPIGLASFTAAVGFFSMLTSVIPPFQHIGIMCGAGVVIGYLLTLTFLPSLLMVLPERWILRAGKRTDWRWPAALGELIARHYRTILIAMVLLPVPAVIGFAHLEIDDHFVRLFKKGTWFRDGSDAIESKLAGVTTIDFSLHAGAPDGITDPRFLLEVEDVKRHLLADPIVTHIAALTDTLKRINKAMHRDDPNYYRIPEDQTTAGQALLFYELNQPFGLELNSIMNVDKSALRFTITTKSATTRETIAFVERTNEWLARVHPDLQARAVSVLVMFSYMAKAVAINAFSAAGIAIALVVFVIAVGLRSIRLCLIAVLSNIIPVVLVLGIWHWLGHTLDFTAGLIFSMTFGVIVDNSLHIMYWYTRGIRQERKSVADAMRGAVERRGPAMVLSTLTLILGFSVFGLSNFFVNVTLGFLTALVFAVGLVWDLLMTPSLLMLLRPHTSHARDRQRAVVSTATDDLAG
jgi:predicted RND superfamily exporter protein